MNESPTDSDTISFISVVSLMYNFGKKRMEKGDQKLMNLWFILTQREYFFCVCCACTDWDLSLVSEQVHDDKQGTDRASRGEAWRSSRRNAANGGGNHRQDPTTRRNYCKTTI